MIVIRIVPAIWFVVMIIAKLFPLEVIGHHQRIAVQVCTCVIYLTTGNINNEHEKDKDCTNVAA